jgi:hypothetical protein
MGNALVALAVGGVLVLTVSCAGLSTGVGFYGGSGYYPSLYADPFGPPGYPYRYGLGFGPSIYSSPLYYAYPPGFFSPYRPYPYRYGGHGLRRHHHR